MDGSFHGWLEGRGPDGCLMNRTDDATSTVELRLDEEEAIWAAAAGMDRKTRSAAGAVRGGRKLPWKEIFGTAPPVQAERKPSQPFRVAACAAP
jgi:hypothetical protein